MASQIPLFFASDFPVRLWRGINKKTNWEKFTRSKQKGINIYAITIVLVDVSLISLNIFRVLF